MLSLVVFFVYYFFVDDIYIITYIAPPPTQWRFRGHIPTWIAVFQGYDCEPTSEGISRATTKTVVYASLAVLGLDFILTALMFGDF